MLKNKYQNSSDDELVALMKGSRKEADLAFRALYNRHASRLHAYCLRVVQRKEAAEDIFQETFVRFYQHVRENYDSGSIAGFLITIARNLCLNYKRDNKGTVPLEEFHLVYDGAEINQRIETQKLIKLAFDLLEFDYREPLILRLYDGLSYKDIGEICHISEENARARVFRAKQKIKAALEPHYRELFG